MNNIERISIIISSMSKPEKRGFKLYCNTQKGEKMYITLFDIVDNLATEEKEKIQNRFEKENAGKNIEVAAGYLYKLLLNFLVQKRVEKSVQAKIFRQIEISKVLFERKLPDEAAEELLVAQKMAEKYEDDIMQMLASRVEMAQIEQLGFVGLSEKELIAKQMKLQAIMKYSRTINQHIFLLDILNHRLLYKHYYTMEEEKEMLTDLVLSELHVISNSSYAGFQAEKIHLLFQSAYYIEVGNYISAVRNYKRLLELFKENFHLIQNPPIYYLNAVVGVLESLFTAGIYEEMKHFVEVLHRMGQEEYPVDFLLRISWLEYYYRMMPLLQTGEWEEMENIEKVFADRLLSHISYLPLDVQLEYCLLKALLLFSKGHLKEAHKSLKPVFSSGKIFQRLPLFRLVRVVNLLIIVEMGGSDFVDVEIAALKRSSGGRNLSKTERLVLKFVQDYPLPSYPKMRERMANSYKNKINIIRKDKLERRILKYFDFLTFMESKFTGISFQSLLRKKASSSCLVEGE